MKKKNLIIMYLLITPFLISAQTYKVDVFKSSLSWKGIKISGEHYGFVEIHEGYVTISNDKITGGEFIIDMKKILITDTEDEEKRKDILEDLSGKTFFNVAEYPVSKFVIKGYSNGILSGLLTIKGITNSIQFNSQLVLKCITKLLLQQQIPLKYKEKNGI
jgi:polyisoprenoid-binding protein YceI